MIVFFLCGLWHGASWNFVVWGLFHGMFLVVERLGLASLVARAPRPVGHVYALAVAMVGWVFFRAESVSHAVGYLAALVGRQGPVASPYTPGFYLNVLVVAAIGAGVVGSGPWMSALGRRVLSWQPATPRLTALASAAIVVALAAVMGAAALFVASSSYSPFIYFRF